MNKHQRRSPSVNNLDDNRCGVPKPPIDDETLGSAKIQIERKTFLFALKENGRGRFLRISEEVAGRRNTIIIPAPGLRDFEKMLDEMLKASNETPSKGPSLAQPENRASD